MSRAITTHELSTRTSMPAILATRQDVPNIAVSPFLIFHLSPLRHVLKRRRPR
jgi:hypothetical protein